MFTSAARGIFNLFDLGFVLSTGFLKSSFGFCNCLFFRLAADLPRDAVLRVAPFLAVPVLLSADERSAATRCSRCLAV